MDQLKIGVIKSEVYQDLWACDKSTDYIEIFKTSMMRCPPIGLAEKYNADFIIVKESKEFPCQINKGCLPEKFEPNMKFSKELKNPTLPFLDETYHKHISINEIAYDCDSIDFEKYNIIICVNTCIPERIINKFQHILWCYYVGENNIMNNLISKYDILLNQDVSKTNFPNFSIGFPYSFIDSYTINNLINTLYPNIDNVKKGIFVEINNTQERPVVSIPPAFMYISHHCNNIPIILHSQNIVENIKRIYSSKYFVKIFGRVIRGNGILEVISAGTLILINKNLILFKDLIPDECHVITPNDVIQKIKYLENNENEYNRLVSLQRTILNEKYFEKPLQDLYNKYKLKININ